MDNGLQIAWSSTTVSAPYVLLAVSFALVLKVSKIWNFSQPAAMGIAFYAMIFGTVTMGLPLVLAVPIGIVAAILFNVLVESIGFRSLRARRAPSMTYFIFTLVMTQLVGYIILMLAGSQGRILGNTILYETFNVGRLTISVWDLRAVGVAALALLLFAMFIRSSPWGARMLAVSNNPDLAALHGIRVSTVYLLTMSISGILVGLAMYLLGSRVAITPEFGLAIIVETVAAVIIGGIGNVWGAALAAIGIRLVQGFSVLIFPSLWQGFIVYVFMFVVIIAVPSGVPGLVSRLSKTVRTSLRGPEKAIA